MYLLDKERNMKSGLAKLLLAVGVAILLSILAGCQSLNDRRPPPVTVGKVVEMSKSAVSAQNVIRTTANWARCIA
jgi:hypothetical protein